MLLVHNTLVMRAIHFTTGAFGRSAKMRQKATSSSNVKRLLFCDYVFQWRIQKGRNYRRCRVTHSSLDSLLCGRKYKINR